VLFLLALLLTSCSVEKNTSLSRNYHNLTSHYNIYFNGNESYKKGIEKAWDAAKNDYTQILPLFLYEDEAVNAAVNADMKRAIDKATRVITFHSITAKPKVKEGEQSDSDKAFYEKKEFTKWVDDSYMLMGKLMYQESSFCNRDQTRDGDLRRDQVPMMTWLARAIMSMNCARQNHSCLLPGRRRSAEYRRATCRLTLQYDIRKGTCRCSGAPENALLQKGLQKEEKIRYTISSPSSMKKPAMKTLH
jgi:hypothetical protein